MISNSVTRYPSPPGPPDAAHDEEAARAAGASHQDPRHGILRAGAKPAVLVAGVVTGYVLIRGRADGNIGPWGIIEALPRPYLLLLLLPAIVFFHELRRGMSRAILSLALVAQVITIYGSVAFSESMPRFATAWLHAGFTTQILQTGETATGMDARFSWPGFFAAAGVFSEAVGLEPLSLLRWAPMCFALLFLAPLALLFRALHGSARVRWAGLWVFTVANWVGQDYFAPQAFAFFLHLAGLSVVTAVFLGGARGVTRSRPAGRIRALLTLPADVNPEGAAVTHGQRSFLIVSLVIVSAAVAMSHQLTPFMLAMTLCLLALTGVLRIALLPLATVIVTVGWLCYGAQDYWNGHMSAIFGSAGQVSSVVSSGVGSRIVGSTVHQVIVNLRIATAGIMWLLASAGLIHLLRSKKYGLILGIIAGAPFLMLGLQDYGGEGMLRVYLFSLPATALLAAHACVSLAARSRPVAAVVAVAGLLVLPVSLVARYGNESYEHVSAQEGAAVAALYDIAPHGSTLVCLSPNLSWRNIGLSQYDYAQAVLDQFAVRRVDLAIAAMGTNPKGAYLIVTRGQIAYGEEVYGLPADWGRSVQRDIVRSRRFTTVFHNDDATVYRLEPVKEARR
ncbi:hypothetical protein GCM10010435_82460 [Winogradskya consettensis]|uniref:Uncharacterized protein n=1 Tax=Winogradskya consettensis TaxID=113560 RepID=A0A919SXF4_9ACTN|nr:hypothetical protein [Actinoplanes consettensis]GIM79142.1 hypothetical protein Aco04nite_64040 [Actinoplanes consettensis]